MNLLFTRQLNKLLYLPGKLLKIVSCFQLLIVLPYHLRSFFSPETLYFKIGFTIDARTASSHFRFRKLPFSKLSTQSATCETTLVMRARTMDDGARKKKEYTITEMEKSGYYVSHLGVIFYFAKRSHVLIPALCRVQIEAK